MTSEGMPELRFSVLDNARAFGLPIYKVIGKALVPLLDPPRRASVTHPALRRTLEHFAEQMRRITLDPPGSSIANVTGQPGYMSEVRVTSDTGGQKGSKPRRFDMIPPDVLAELADHYGKGAAKYPGDPATGEANWQKGYAWSLSAAALQRHLYAWLCGEDTDAETGSSHLIAVVWHCMALRWWQLHGRGTDDLQGRRNAVPT